MPSYSSFKYARKLYGDVGLSRSSSLLFARVVDYDRVIIESTTPDRVGSQYVLVRTNNGAAQDPSAGRVIAQGTFTSRVTSFEDQLESFTEGVSALSTSPSGTSAYYTLFAISEDQAWFKDGATSVVIPKNANTAMKIATSLPTVLLSDQSDILFPGDITNSDLYKFLYGIGLTFDELTTLIDFILPENRDLQVTRRLHELLVTGKGMPNEYTIGVAANARLHRNAGYIYRNKGTIQGIETFAEALTGWNSLAVPSNNRFLSLDDGSFEYSTGNWSVNPSQMTLTRVEINGDSVTGPTMPYETEAYPFSKKALGRATLLVTGTSRMSLPGTIDRKICIPVTGGRTYYLAVPVKAHAGAPRVTPSVLWLDQTGAEISSAFIGDVVATSSWLFSEGTVVAPMNAAFAGVRIDIQGSSSNAVDLDCLSFSEGVVERRTNLVQNAAVSNGTTGFALVATANRALDTSTAQVWVGASSLRVRNTSATAQTLEVMTTQTIAAVPGETYTASVYVYPTTSLGFRLRVDWRNDASSVLISNNSYQTLSANQWSRLNYTVTAPVGVNNLRLRVQTQSTVANTQTVFLDGFLIEQSPKLGAFFTGTTGTVYGSSNAYGTYVYSAPEFGFVYRDPRSVTVILQPERINLLLDPGFELPNASEVPDPDQATPWVAETGTFSTSTESVQTGSRAAKMSGASWRLVSERVPVVGSFPYAIAATARSAAGTCQMLVRWFDYSDAFLTEELLPFDLQSGDWVREQQTVTAPPTASYAIVQFAGTGTVYLDNAMMERADRPLTFFSGDVSNIDNTDGRWSNSGPRAYALLYNNAPIKLGRLKQTLPYYLPQGMTGRVLLWDSEDPEVQLLIPRGIYANG